MKHLSKLTITFASLALLLLGGGTGYFFAMRQMPMNMAATAPATAAASKPAKALYWYDPMVPAQHFDAPGKSPFMDMQLVPKYAASDAEMGGELGVRIDATTLQNLGVRTALVEVLTPEQNAQHATISLPGVLKLDERAVSIEQTRMAGFVERVFALAPGDVIRAGQPLAEMTVPAWSGAQQEFLALRASGDRALIAAARERLRLTGMPEASIQTLIKSGRVQQRFTIFSTRAGVIQELDVRMGMNMMAGQTLARINGMESIWCEIAVPESFAAQLVEGARASVQLNANPGSDLVGTIDAILPVLDEASRSVRVRINLKNTDGLLRAGMAATVQLQSVRGENTRAGMLTVPTEAVIRTGKRALVMRVQGKGGFVPVEVSLGQELGARTVILQGLEAGDSVVASGQFLLDSEASLSGVGFYRNAAETRPAMREMPLSAGASAPLHAADATILAIESDSIKLKHGPFESLKMPGMTMSFGYADALAPRLREFKVGDAVRVWVREDASGLVIERLEARAPAPMQMEQGQ